LNPAGGLVRRLLGACGFDEWRCAACHVPFRTGSPSFLCETCAASLGPVPALCPICGAALAPEVMRKDAGGVIPLRCGACLTDPPPWERLYVVSLYQGALRDLLLRIKYHGDRGLARGMGALLAGRIRTGGGPLPDAVVPMPLHPGRLRQRGFNQCYEIARPVADTLGIPARPFWAWRTRAVQPQTGLSRKERLRNLDAVFAASPEVRGKRVLILDDTMTTGTSLRRLGECLLEQGAAAVEAAAVATVAAGWYAGEV